MKMIFELENSQFQPDLTEYFSSNNINSLDEIDEKGLCSYLYEDCDIADYLWDYIHEAVGDMQDMKGSFELETDTDRVYNFMKSYLEDHADSYLFYIRAEDEHGNVSGKRQISFVTFLLRMLESDYEGCPFYRFVSDYIERSLLSFVENAKWHCGIVDKYEQLIASDEGLTKEIVCSNIDENTPVVWFGTDANILEKKWTFGLGCENYNPFNISGNIADLVDGSNEAFEIWYHAECGCGAPDFTEDIPECPARIEADDDDEVIREKIIDYIRGLLK